MTDEGRPCEVRSEVAVPDPEKGGTKVSGARRVLQDHPRKILAILLAVLLGAGYFIRSAFRYEDTDDAQVDGHIMPLSARINGYVLEVPVIEGQLVHAGDVLVTIDPTDFEIAMHQAQATFATRWPAPQVLASTCRSPPLRRKATSIQQVLRS